MIDTLTAIFCGAMIVVLPLLLLRTLATLEERNMIIAWSLMALLAWVASIWMVFLSPLVAMLGVAGGGLFAWLARAKPDFRA